MTTIQDKFFRQLDAAVTARKHELVTKSAWANTGAGYVQPVDGFTPISTFSYDFQDRSATFTVNDTKIWATYTSSDAPNVKTLAQVIDAILAPVPAAKRRRIRPGRMADRPAGKTVENDAELPQAARKMWS